MVQTGRFCDTINPRSCGNHVNIEEPVFKYDKCLSAVGCTLNFRILFTSLPANWQENSKSLSVPISAPIVPVHVLVDIETAFLTIQAFLTSQ